MEDLFWRMVVASDLGGKSLRREVATQPWPSTLETHIPVVALVSGTHRQRSIHYRKPSLRRDSERCEQSGYTPAFLMSRLTARTGSVDKHQIEN